VTSHRHIILGYPESGKTTYLAALWHVIDAGLADTSLVLEKISGDAEYLNKIVEAWLRCEKVPRTYISNEEHVALHVRDTKTQSTMVLTLPDFSGETFQEIFADRQCAEEFVENANGTRGILFFVNADRADDMASVLDHVFDDDEDAGGDDDAVPEGFADFDPRKTPEQTRIVELLQLLQVRPFDRRHRRLVIAISAWDVVQDDGVSPAEWIAREMPLLDQFLRNNSEFYDVRFCGISAQGGMLNDDTRTSLLEQKPAERVICHWQEKSGPDITQPLRWLSADDE
jgi:hypothetical protein